MCTYVNQSATDARLKQLKNKSIGYAWKAITIYKKTGQYCAPFYEIPYNQHNVIAHKERATSRATSRLTSGVFHLSLTRKNARLLAKWLQNSFYNTSNKHSYKVVKVSFKPEHLVVVGRSSYGDKREFGLADGPDSLCVAAFDFVDKIK